MNFTFYSSLAHLPIGVAVTIEFIGPLTLAAVLSRRCVDAVAVAAAGLGVVLISEALSTPLDELELVGIALALAAGAFWAAYIVLSGRTGAQFPRLEGLALAMVVATVGDPAARPRQRAAVEPETLAQGAGHRRAVVGAALLARAAGPAAAVSARVFGILLSLEPAAAALAGLLVLDQRLTPTQLLGMGLVVAALSAGAGTRGAQGPATASRPARDRAGAGRLGVAGRPTGVALVAAGLHQAERPSSCPRMSDDGARGDIQIGISGHRRRARRR